MIKPMATQLDMLNPETDVCAGCGNDTRIALTDVRGWCWCRPCLDSGLESPWDANSWCARHEQRTDMGPCTECVGRAL